MSLKSLMVVLVLSPAVALGQVRTTADLTPPPMVPATPPPMPAPEPTSPQLPGTPPPPSSATPGTGYQPGQSGYQYSPYGQPKAQEKPGPEVGLMVSEGLFGALTAAGITLLPYFLLFQTGTLGDPSASPVPSIIFVVIFGAAPLAVAQTQVSLANGSRHYQVETWVPALTGLVGEAAVLGIYYATGWLPSGWTSGGVPKEGSLAWLMIGSIGLVPLLQMAAINLFKQPKFGQALTFGDPNKGLGIALAPPAASPVLSLSDAGRSVGFQISFLRGRF